MAENPVAYFHQCCIIGTLKENKFGQISIFSNLGSFVRSFKVFGKHTLCFLAFYCRYD